MQLTAAIITIALYSLCLGLIFRIVALKEKPGNAFIAIFALSIIAHVFHLHFNVFPNNTLHLGFYRVSTLIFCVISIISLAAVLRRIPIESLLILLFPCTILSIIVSHWFQSPTDKIITESGLITHIVLSLTAYSIITIAALQSLMLSAQEYLLKKHDLGGLFKYLPPLQTMESLLFEMIWVGFALLTLSIGSGFLFLEDMFAQHLAHKTILSICAWLIFAILLYGRYAQGWRGRTASRWTIGGFFVLMLAYFGTKFVLEIILQRV